MIKTFNLPHTVSVITSGGKPFKPELYSAIQHVPEFIAECLVKRQYRYLDPEMNRKLTEYFFENELGCRG